MVKWHPIHLLVPQTAPDDWTDVRSGLKWAAIGAVPIGPSDFAALGSLYGAGKLTLSTAGRVTGVGALVGALVGFHYGVYLSNVEQSRLGSIMSSQRYGTFTPSTRGVASAQKTRRAQGLVSRGSAQRGRERLTPWCRVHKRRHWCRFTRK